MAKKFQNLRNSMSQERREKIDAMTQDMLAEMPMYELRRARQLSQEQLDRKLWKGSGIGGQRL